MDQTHNLGYRIYKDTPENSDTSTHTDAGGSWVRRSKLVVAYVILLVVCLCVYILTSSQSELNGTLEFLQTNFPNTPEGMLARDDYMCGYTQAHKHTHSHKHRCLGPPYIYVTFHGGKKGRPKSVKNVCKFTRNGCPLGAALMPSEHNTLGWLRGMLIHEEQLFVVQSWREESKLSLYSKCVDTKSNRRVFLKHLAHKGELNGTYLDHPYSLAVQPLSNAKYLYVSSQDNSEIIKYDMNSMVINRPFDLSNSEEHALAERTPNATLFAHLNVQAKHEGVRGIALDTFNRLYVAVKAIGVLVYDDTGKHLHTFDVKNAISVFFVKQRNSLVVGCSKSNTLHEFDVSTKKLVQVIRHRMLKHPSGISAYGNDLYVISQRKNKLLLFDLDSGKLKSIVVRHLPDRGEFTILSSC